MHYAMQESSLMSDCKDIVVTQVLKGEIAELAGQWPYIYDPTVPMFRLNTLLYPYIYREMEARKANHFDQTDVHIGCPIGFVRDGFREERGVTALHSFLRFHNKVQIEAYLASDHDL